LSGPQFSCLYPILFRNNSYVQYRFKRYTPGPRFEKLTPLNCPPRYAHALHAGSMLYQCVLRSDETLLEKAWPRLGFVAGRFVPSDSGCTLLYDSRYGMFLMDFSLSIELESWSEGTDPAPILQLQEQIRALLVADPRTPAEPCAWAMALQEQSLALVRSEMKSTIAPEMIEIPPSMGYLVSTFPEAAEVLPTAIRQQLLAHFHSGDLLAEQLPRMQKLPIAGPDREVFLGWQSSTLWGVSEERCLELFPVFLSIQLIYTLYSVYFLAQTEELFEEIFYYDEDRFRHLQARTDRMLILVDKTIHDKDVFESKLRPIQQSVFANLWDYWGMKKMLDACERSLHSSKRSLEMNINIIHEKMGERQNNLLFVLAIIQIVAMMGIINDYLALNDRFSALSFVILGGLLVATTVVFIFSYYERILSWLRSRAQ
jgi:hypothetical protein